MKHPIVCALLTAGLSIAATTASHAAVPRLDVAGISKYVYPDNRRCNLTATPAYMPDGETYLQVSADGKKIISYNTADGKETATIFDSATTRENNFRATSKASPFRPTPRNCWYGPAPNPFTDARQKPATISSR